MDESPPNDETPSQVPESPKPLSFTIEFDGGKPIDKQRHKHLVEKYQNRHRRGQSLSKLEDPPVTVLPKKHPLSGNLPRKSSFQSEGYYSSDEKSERTKNVRSAVNNARSRGDLTLPLKNVTTDKMTQSFPNCNFNLPSIKSPDVELENVSSPELDLISPFSPRLMQKQTPSPLVNKKQILRQYSSPESISKKEPENQFVPGNEFDFDKSDSVSDAGTYTLDADNYTEEQKARMSIDREFNIEQVSVMQKAEEYIQSLNSKREKRKMSSACSKKETVAEITQKIHNLGQNETLLPSPRSPLVSNRPLIPPQSVNYVDNLHKIVPTKLSPILSPTQNVSITQNLSEEVKHVNCEDSSKTFSKILFPSIKSKTGIGLEQAVDQGCFTSVTASGAFSKKIDNKLKGYGRQPSLSKSEIQVEAYTGRQNDNVFHAAVTVTKANGTSDLTQKRNVMNNEVKTNLPLAISGFSGKNSPTTKIPSPRHSVSRPRSRSSVSSLNVDLSDSSLETESYLKPTANFINSLQQRLSMDSDQDSDYENRIKLNNETRDLLKQKLSHARHNSFDDKNFKVTNKLEHFQEKNLQEIDQTFKYNQYHSVASKIQNSPNNSPIRRSSSFSTKMQLMNQPKSTNVNAQTNLRYSPNFMRNGSIQRSASTASIKPNIVQLRRSSINSDHQKIDRNQFGDTESSSEEDFERQKKKDSITNTRYNRAFSLRRARLDAEPSIPPKCPNTPEMRRKFPDHVRGERAISVDRKPTKSNEIQSRYLLNINKNKNVPARVETPKVVPKTVVTKLTPNKPQVFSRTDSGRFSMKTSKPPVSNPVKKKDGGKKQSGPRSNSSLSSREMEFQNWKRRKSYDPMKAAAEGKRKAELAKKQNVNVMTQSYTGTNQNQDCDSSPSHSSSVHRSQSFHGTAALEQLISSDEEDLTLSADEDFSPTIPSPSELSPSRAYLRYALQNRFNIK